MLPSYDTSVVPRGYAIIIVNKFENSKDLKRRGAEKEVSNLENMFSTLGFEPKVLIDLTKDEMLRTLYEYSKKPELGEHSMIAVAIWLVFLIYYLCRISQVNRTRQANIWDIFLPEK